MPHHQTSSLTTACKLTATQEITIHPNMGLAAPTPHEIIPPNQPVSKQRYRPNTKLHYTLFTTHSISMALGQLKAKGWKQLTRNFPDTKVIIAIQGICAFGARIGNTKQWSAPTIYPNLATAKADAELVSAEIITELSKNRLEMYSNITDLLTHYTASPLGLTEKADGTKRCIHHLSYPSDNVNAINSGIPEEFRSIVYSSIDDAVAAVQQLGKGCTMIKHDFESAFRHIPISPYNSPLLGFHWENKFYAKRLLPFGLWTAPYLFNLFAKVFHWILEEQLRKQNIPPHVIHYLDDFLIVIPPGYNPEQCSSTYSALFWQVGLIIKHSKDEEGTTASIAGLEFNSQKMVVRLPEKKLAEVHAIIANIRKLRSALLLDIQKITGYLNFVSFSKNYYMRPERPVHQTLRTLKTLTTNLDVASGDVAS